MNAIVLVALKRPLTFVVLAILILIFGGLAVWRTPTDIFPGIGIPVVAVIWTYAGLSPADMSGRVVYYFERTMTTTVANIEHIESQSLYGRGVVKIFFQPGTDVAAAQAQIAASAQTVLKQMPAGITPPAVLVYDASSVPVMDLQVSGTDQTVTTLYNLASNFIRPALITVPGVAIPTPYGGTSEVVAVDLSQRGLLEHGLSAQDVSAALARQYLVLPAGDEKIGKLDFMVRTNAAPLDIPSFNNLPIKQVGNAIVTLGDVAFVHRGGIPQTNIVLVHGKQAVLMSILKTGHASTLAVTAGIKALLPRIERTMPPGVTITPINDESGFVRDSVIDVVREMVTAAFLTGMMVLLFLGSWRSTLIVATSIPLCILTSIAVLSWLGQTVNVMTLGGLALAVGILVDDATVMIENIAAHLETGQELEAAIVEAANQIVVPTFVATLCICIVWLPLFSLSGIGGYLFRPLAMAIIFAMVASFLLSRTLVPTMAAWLLRGQVHHAGDGNEGDHGRGPFGRFQRGFERRFARMRDGYRDLLGEITAASGRFMLGFGAVTLLSLGLIPFLGRDFFPEINSANLDLHMRAPIGTRIEDTGKLAVLVDGAIERALRPHVRDIVNNCGLPASGINEAYSANGVIGTSDCELTITLDDEDSPVGRDRRLLRRRLARSFPGTQFNFLPGDITAKILNFGLPAPIDVQVIGRDQQRNFDYAKTLLARIDRIPGVADSFVFETMSQPTLELDVSRAFAARTSLTEANVADNALSTLSGSSQVGVSYWLDPRTGVSHLVNVQTPQNEIDTMNDLETVPIDSGNGDPGGEQMQLLGALGRIVQSGMPMIVSHDSITPTINVYASADGRDLGAVGDAIDRVLADHRSGIPRRSQVAVRGQAVTMASSYAQLLGGCLLCVLGGADLPGDRGEFPILDRPVHHHHRPARRARGHRLGPVRHRHDAVGAGAHGGDHVHGHGHRELHPRGLLRPRAPRRARRGGARRGGGRIRASPPGADDRARDDHRHAADVDEQHAERPARPRRDGRPAGGHRLDPAVRAVGLHVYPRAPPRRAPRAQPRRRGGAAMTARRARRRLLLAGAAAVAIAVAAFGIVERRHDVATLAVEADDSAVPDVTLVSPQAGPPTRSLTLPGDVDAWHQAPIFAQVSGYVKTWYKDYGAQVKAGDLLAVIDTPDLDQQLAQAQAQLKVAQARYELAVVTAKRWKSLAGTQAVSQQEVDVNLAGAKEAASEVDAARFNVARYQAQESFKRVVAPFDGVVTARQTDIGNYVTAAGGNASGRGGATELFSVADLHQMRVFVSVPQDDSGSLRPGLTARVVLPQFPHQVFGANFATTANSFNTQSRTVLTELLVDNTDRKIWPGAFAEVHFTVPSRPGLLVVPEQALLFRSAGLQVAIVRDGHVHLQNVTLGLNLGNTVQIAGGLDARDRLIGNPSDGLLEGQEVHVVEVPPPNADDDGEGARPAGQDAGE